MRHTKTKIRRGIGYVGRVFTFGTAFTAKRLTVLSTRHGINDDAVKMFNKDPSVKRAAKKRQRLDDLRAAL